VDRGQRTAQARPHEYTLEQFGLTRAAVHARFAPYLERYGLTRGD